MPAYSRHGSSALPVVARIPPDQPLAAMASGPRRNPCALLRNCRLPCQRSNESYVPENRGSSRCSGRLWHGLHRAHSRSAPLKRRLDDHQLDWQFGSRKGGYGGQDSTWTLSDNCSPSGNRAAKRRCCRLAQPVRCKPMPFAGRREGCPSDYHRRCGSASFGYWPSLRVEQPFVDRASVPQGQVMPSLVSADAPWASACRRAGLVPGGA
jgi:hypothetical protein